MASAASSLACSSSSSSPPPFISITDPMSASAPNSLVFPYFGSFPRSFSPTLCSKASKARNSSRPEFVVRVRKKTDKRVQERFSTQKTFRSSLPTVSITRDDQQQDQDVLDDTLPHEGDVEQGEIAADGQEHNHGVAAEQAVLDDSLSQRDEEKGDSDTSNTSIIATDAPNSQGMAAEQAVLEDSLSQRDEEKDGSDTLNRSMIAADAQEHSQGMAAEHVVLDDSLSQKKEEQDGSEISKRNMTTIQSGSLVGTEEERIPLLSPDVEDTNSIGKAVARKNDCQYIDDAEMQKSLIIEVDSVNEVFNSENQILHAPGKTSQLLEDAWATQEQRILDWQVENKRPSQAEDLVVFDNSERAGQTEEMAGASGEQREVDKCTTEMTGLSEEMAGASREHREIDRSAREQRRHHVNIDLRKLQVEELVKKNSVSGKIFFYPEVVKGGNEVEIFLNRENTALANQPKVLAMGAFNDWRWKSFIMELERTEFSGDWWVFKLRVPSEAYRIDFVFFDGDKLYENNSGNDFFVLVEGGMQKEAFEDYLIEEKWKEAERLAAEQLKKEQQAAEERRLAEAKATAEADMTEARRQVNDRREKVRRVLPKAVKSVDDLWKFEPSIFQGGETVKLFYNRAHRPLASSREVWVHGGYNNWQDMVSIVGQLSFSGTEAGDWWSVEVAVPERAYVLNWVFADGPPGRAMVYDNNVYQDFHALVPKGVPDDLFWADVEHQIYRKIRKERHKQEEAARMKVEHTARLKEQMKAKTKKLFLQSQAHIFYTDPIDVQAGKPVTIFYNPTNTVLNGKPEVWIRGSFNRWTHRSGCFPPIKMQPARNVTHLKAVVNIPIDAYMMDFVFSERGGQDGGIYDNRNGLDYHVPVAGGIVNEPPMYVVHVSVEMAPIAKVGGLGDVVTSLSRAVQDLGHNVEVILPKYDCLNYKHVQNLEQKSDFFWGGTRIKVWNGNVEGLPVTFLEPENGMFWVGCIYGRRDDGPRFGFFCHAALEFLLQSGQHPDIIHCHDWSSAPVAWLFQDSYKHYGLSNARVVFTIHNLEFGTSLISKAMASAHMATTVSYTYAQEVSRNPAIAPHLHKFHGIRNGIDLDIWDPYNDPYIPMQYMSENMTEGKRLAKIELQRKLHLEELDRPLVGIVTRLTAQKGIHLIKHGIWRTLDRGGQVVLLGSSPDPRIQSDFNNLANQLHNTRGDMARLCLSYDEPLSHLIYAAADLILVPSVFEPCGLTQLIAMRYGALPVVRRTGGLNDTVFDVDHHRNRAQSQCLEPNGFSFDGIDAAGLDYALNRALSAWYDARVWFNSLCKQVMEQDWSWNRPALDYMELYYGAKK